MLSTTKQPNKPVDRLGLVIALIPAGIALYLGSLIQTIMAGATLEWSVSWVPSLGVEFALLVDGLSLLFGLIISGVGALVIIYAAAYLAGKSLLRLFYIYILLFMTAMLGVVFSRNLMTTFVFWELTSLSSYLLIGFYHQKNASRKAALQALLVTGSGGLVLLVGILLLGNLTGSFDIVVLASQSGAIQIDALYPVILVLILIGAFSKSAQFPFHFWLPNAMEAPAPVSAYLHSATMVKAGIFLLARLTPILGGTQLWTQIIVPVGAFTMLLSAGLSLGQTDLKRILAYSTLSVLGMLTFLLGLGSPLAIKTALVLLVAHALYKGALFLAAGAVDHETGSREITILSGLRGIMPLTALAASLAALSQAGLPLLFGFISKELIYETTLDWHQNPVVLTALPLIANILLVAAAGLVALKPFYGQLQKTPKTPHEAPWPMTLGPLLLSLLSLSAGIFPQRIGETLIAPAAAATLGEAVKVKLALWHGFTPMLTLSAVTVLLGAVIYVYQQPLRMYIQNFDLGSRIGPSRLYLASLTLLERLATRLTRNIQNGSLPRYILIVVLASLGLIGFSLQGVHWDNVFRLPAGVHFYEWLIVLIIPIATLAAVRAHSRLAAVAALGAVGFSIAMIYTLFGAPDLAMTQFAIETLTVILFVLVLYRLPRFVRYTDKVTRTRDAVVAISAGVMMTVLVLLVTATPLTSRLTPFFAENSYPLAKGRNIVNVILVDFRGIDTLGEITVLVVAAIGVLALMKMSSEN
jgi:multicomponent Na+:H+ antiporter subunit A